MKLVYLKKAALFLCFTFILLIFTGCSKQKEEIVKIKDLEFTVVEEADLPEELLKSINEKKSTPFKMTYSNDDYLYIVRGYGEQKTGGYSITVDNLFLADNGIYFESTLIGPGQDELVTQVISTPYIVVKLEFIDKKVVFN